MMQKCGQKRKFCHEKKRGKSNEIPFNPSSLKTIFFSYISCLFLNKMNGARAKFEHLFVIIQTKLIPFSFLPFFSSRCFLMCVAQNYPDISNRTAALMSMPKGRYQHLKKLIPLLVNQSEDCLTLNIYVPGSGKYWKRCVYGQPCSKRICVSSRSRVPPKRD